MANVMKGSNQRLGFVEIVYYRITTLLHGGELQMSLHKMSISLGRKKKE